MVKVLIAHHDRQFVHQIRKMLDTFKYGSDYVTRAGKLLAKMEREPIDLVLLDTHLPDKKGLTLLKTLKRHPVYKGVPVIMLTEEGEEQMMIKCFECGAFDCFCRPLKGAVFKARLSLAVTTRTRLTDLKKLNDELGRRVKKSTASLEEMNTTLRVLLGKREEDKIKIGENIYVNFKSLIQPLLHQLKNSLTSKDRAQFDLLESNIKEMISPFSKKLANPLVGLTPTEIQVAALVRNGETNKEIAVLLNKSIRAITSHRESMRLKLGLKNKKINLRTYLMSIE